MDEGHAAQGPPTPRRNAQGFAAQASGGSADNISARNTSVPWTFSASCGWDNRGPSGSGHTPKEGPGGHAAPNTLRADLVQLWNGYFRAVFTRGCGPFPPEFPSPYADPLQQYYQAYHGSGERAPRPECIPEPYLGDIVSNDIRTIFLNLNPGRPLGDGEGDGTDPRADETGPVPSPSSPPSGAPQDFSPRSEFGAAICRSGYHVWARAFPYLSSHLNNYGGRFWRRRLAFARDLLAGPGAQPRGASVEPVSVSQIVGMELWPWHSVQWGTLDPELALPALRRLVVGPLTELAFARGPHQAPIIAVGQPFTTVLPLLGFRGVPCNAPLPLPSGNRTLHLFRTGISETSRPILIAVLVNRYQCGPPTPHGKDGGLDLALVRKTLRRFQIAV